MIQKYLDWVNNDDINEWSLPVGAQIDYQYPGYYEFISPNEKEYYETIKNDDRLEYYIENPLKYRLNSQGFRMETDLKDGASVNIFLGCSDTFGYGLHQEHTWSYKLHKHINNGEEYWNLALPGNGVQTDFRTLYYVLNKYGRNIKISNIFHLLQYRFRFEIFDDIGPQIITVNQYGKDENKTKLEMDLLHETNNKLWYSSNVNAIENLARKYKSNYYVTSIQYLIDNNINTHDNFHILYDYSLEYLPARDLGHPSYKSNHEIFSAFLDMYNSKLQNKII